MQAAADFEPDVVIVGSGASGSMAALVLARAGVRTLILEAGRDYDPYAETPMFQTEAEAPLRAVRTPDKPFGYYDATVNAGWEVPGEPYTSAEGSEFMWWRARMLGGRTNHWSRHTPRCGPYDFKPYSRDGLGVDWPISYEDVAPWYDRTERLVGVFGANSGLENHPDSSPGILHPPPRPRVHELLVQAAAGDLGVPCAPSRHAILTRPIPDADAPRHACFYATDCHRGCSIGAAFQTTTSLLPMAMGTGNLRIQTGAMAARVRTRADGRAEGVEYFDVESGALHFARARVVILAASACESARLLLNSADDGLANSSGQVGRNLTDTVGAHVGAHIPALEDRPRYNDDGAMMPHLYIPFWLYQEQARGELDFPRGYHFEINGRMGAPDGEFGAWADGYGADLKRETRRGYGAYVGFSIRGEMIPNAQSFCELDPGVKDRFGLPVLRFHWRWGDTELRQLAHAAGQARAILERMGGVGITPEQPPGEIISKGGEIIHELGVTRMGERASDSVVNSFGQAWDVDNLLIVDGGVFASNPHKNPTLTIMALTWRNTQNLVERMRRGDV